MGLNSKTLPAAPVAPPTPGLVTTVTTMMTAAEQPLPGWTMRSVDVSPALATELLKLNRDNRKVRLSTVKRYARMMANGEWVLTTEALVITDSHRLINGQHRLHAILHSGITIPMLIIEGVPESVYRSIDRGASRSIADAMKRDARVVEVAGFMTRLRYNRWDRTEVEVAKMVDIIEPYHAMLIGANKATAIVWSNSPIRAAAIIHLMNGKDSTYILKAYDDLITGAKAVSTMDPIIATAFGNVVKHRLTKQHGEDGQRFKLAYAWQLFDPARARQTRIRITNLEDVHEEILDTLTRLVP